MEKSKSLAILLLLSFVSIACAFVFSACVTEPSAHTHTWDNGEVTTVATCEQEGVKTFTCTGCKETKTEKIAATGHTWDKGEITTVATCEQEGVKTFTCTSCKETKTEKIAATGHTWSTEWSKDGYYHWHACLNGGCNGQNNKAEHDFTNGDCVCGEKALVSAISLEYKLNGGGQSYSVVGIGTATDTDIVIPSEYNGKPVTSIGDMAFSDCSSLTSVTIPASVTNIGNMAFCDCSNLTSITIPNSVTNIGNMAFCDCSNLTSITIPDSVTYISASAFQGCSSLTSITISDGVTGIGTSAFYKCSKLTSITIPNSVTSIGWLVFCDCSSLTSITFKGTKAQWNAIEKVNEWDKNTGNYTIHCTDGDIVKS